MDKGIMVADSFRSEQECCAELALVWKYAKEGKGNYYEVDGYLFRRDKILGESIGQLVHCDASDYEVGCCLIQQDTEGTYRPIAFASQKIQCYAKELGKHRERILGLGSVIRVE
ncbi:uncharacterized protein TNCV_2639681 [Trichonephila clavipes]|nr:uncharacterized protein TNCV_2639681 [Trichonephila clavipes]